jgi:tetratricopeptide (TPR) repeat protein
MRFEHIVSVALLLAAAQIVSNAVAQDEPLGYREAIDAAVVAFDAHDLEEARSLFGRADALYSNARTQRGLGLAEFELRNYVQSIRYLEAALQSQVRPLEGELRELTEKQLAQARTFVGQYVITSKPAFSQLFVDGYGTELTADHALTLRVGDHELELHASDFQPEKRLLTVRGGETETLNIVFAKSLRQSPVSTDSPVSESSWYESPWLWVAVGVVAAGVATGVVVAATSSEPKLDGGTSNTRLIGPPTTK